jgi:hypothetical protein
MIYSDFRDRVRECLDCGRLVRLNREGCYRRHFDKERNGRLHLCAASGYAPAGAALRGLRHLDL